MLEKLGHKWPGARITFNFLMCSLCNEPLEPESTEIMSIMKPHKELEKEIRVWNIKRWERRWRVRARSELRGSCGI